MSKTVVFDIDGVLADFVAGFTAYARRRNPELNIPITSTVQHKDWDIFPGMTAEVVRSTWEDVAKCPYFWEDLLPLTNAAEDYGICNLIQQGYRVYFATNRKTPGALKHTYRWLDSRLGYAANLPISVITTHRKGEFCKVVGADYYIDDKSENADCAAWLTDGKTKAFVIDRQYNSGAKAPHSSKVGRVHTVLEFLEEVEHGKV